MEKHLLITVSDETACLYGVRFFSSFFKIKSSIRLTLFYVETRTSSSERSEADIQHCGTGQKAGGELRKRGEEALEASREILLNWGFPAEQIASKFFFKQFGVVKDIIKEGREGLYDAVVLGRRGYNIFEGVLTTSVSRKILDQDIDFPIWISRRPENGRSNVLLCVDGSDSSLRMADHVGFMLKQEDHSVTVLHVDTGKGKRDAQSILQESVEKLTKNGIPKERIEPLGIRSTRVVQTMLEEVERRSFAVVAVGRVGHHKGLLDEWLVGSKSMKLLESLEKAVLWVSR